MGSLLILLPKSNSYANSICDQRRNEWALGVVNGFVGEWSKVRLPVRELSGVVILPHCLCDFGPSCPLWGSAAPDLDSPVCRQCSRFTVAPPQMGRGARRARGLHWWSHLTGLR